eukprot:11299276-Prorocentrum_lima.AAC.1
MRTLQSAGKVADFDVCKRYVSQVRNPERRRATQFLRDRCCGMSEPGASLRSAFMSTSLADELDREVELGC